MNRPGTARRRSPSRPPVPKARELLFEFYRERDHKFFHCEFRDHGKYGVEALFLDPIDLVIAHLFQDVKDADRIVPAREVAITWAKHERKAMEQ